MSRPRTKKPIPKLTPSAERRTPPADADDDRLVFAVDEAAQPGDATAALAMLLLELANEEKP